MWFTRSPSSEGNRSNSFSRSQIIRLALQGKTTSQICQIMHHSPEAVANYLSTFTRSAQLARQKMQVGQIAFLLRRGPSLVRAYLEILDECRRDRNMTYHLEELLRIGSCGGEKKTRLANLAETGNVERG